MKPAAVRQAAISRPAAAVVSAVAPGHRGWETIAIRPPGRIRCPTQHRSVSWLDLKEVWIQSDETRRVHLEVGRERATRILVPIRYCIQATVTLVEWLQG